MGCNGYDGPYNSAVCAFTENGCLFNLGLDPCEVTDFGDDHPEIRGYFIERMDYHKEHSPDALLVYGEIVGYSEVEPAVQCEEIDFWCPFREYDNVGFEEKLTADLLRLHPLNDRDAETTKDMIAGGLFAVNSMLTVLAVFVVVAALFVARSTRCGRSCLKLRDENTPLLITDINPMMF